jgi:hypothetical protein
MRFACSYGRDADNSYGRDADKSPAESLTEHLLQQGGTARRGVGADRRLFDRHVVEQPVSLSSEFCASAATGAAENRIPRMSPPCSVR